MYIPDIVLEKMEFNMFVRPYDPEYKNTFLGQKYGVTLHEGEEIALDTGCFFSYGGFTADIGYCDDDYLAKYEITLYDKKISYVTYTSSSHLFFEVDGEKIGILVLKQLTDEEIRQLPRGMFYPRILTITDIKNGNFLDADELEDAIVIIDEPTELDDAECVDVN